MIQLIIKNHVISVTEVFLFFLFYDYKLNIIQIKPNQIKKSFNEKSLKF